MQVVNLKHWYSVEQVKDLTGFKYHTQVHRWRRTHAIAYAHLCGKSLYFRDAVNAWLESQPGLFVYRARTIDGQVKVFKRRDYKALIALYKQIMAVPAFDIDLRDWQPYCMLAAEPQPMYLWRIVNNQFILPQVRYKTAYGINFYNVQDIQREFK